MEKLREQYEKEVIPALMKKFEYKSVMQVPRLDKIVINIGLGDTKENPKSLENAMNDLTQITGQRPMITKAKKSIAAFKLREGANVGCKVLLDPGSPFVGKLLDGDLLANDTADLTVLTIAATVFLTALTTFLAAFLIHCGQ